MPFARDRDLLPFEPNLFRDIAWAGQRRIDLPSATRTGTTLIATGADFIAADITAGAVAVHAGVTLEVIDRFSATQLTISLLRESPNSPAIPPPPATNAPLTITSFMPQIAAIHDTLLRALGIEPTDPDATPSAADITNPAAIARLEALGALHLIFTAAAATADDRSILWTKANLYRDRFAALRRRLAVGVDLDGDGLPDATRRLNTLHLIRA